LGPTITPLMSAETGFALSTAPWISHQLTALEASLQALVEVNSFSKNRAGGNQVGQLLKELFSIQGLSCTQVPSQDFADHLVFQSIGNGQKPVALLGHFDTVFPPGFFEGYRALGNLRKGPGVLDMKGGLVVMAWALKSIAATRGLDAIAPLKIVLVSDEEVGSPEGAPLIQREILGCRAALVFESGRANDAIVTSRKGTGQVTARAVGKAAHAGNNYFDGNNAIWALARFVERAQQISDRSQDITVNVGLISGGTSRNTVPAEAVAQLDVRFPNAKAALYVWDRLELAALDAALDGTTLEIHRAGGREPMERTPGTEALLASYAQCAHRHGLGSSEAPRQGGGSDGNTASAMGIPTIDALGPRGQFFHTPNEYIEMDTVIPRAAALADWLLSHA
jgi:glutamate carboxypeptidase